ncbi:alpha-2,3-sialyltransferase, partial [Campylobacter lari]
KLVLPRIKEYTDYHEAIRLKESITYRLGQALIQANKTWYGGGYIRLLFEIRKLKREYCDKRKGNL